MRLILASASPRRRELLSRLTGDFSVVPSRVGETAVGPPAARAVEVARWKARAVAATERGLIIGADTIVVVDGEILGKATTRDQAEAMLRRLSGRSHEVMTGLCVLDTESEEEHTHCERTRVTFRPVDDDEIAAYLDTGEHRDKAGAYAIQGSAARFISAIHGDYTNVMGLPLCRLVLLLREARVRL